MYAGRLSVTFHKYGNVSGRQPGRRTPLPYEMRSPGYPATYDLRGTQREGPAESPQEGGRPTPGLTTLPGVPPQQENGGHSEAGLQGSVPEEAVHQAGTAEPPQEGGRSEVKRSRADSPHGEPRTKPCPPRRRSWTRMPGSEGMETWRPMRSRAGSSHGEPRTEPRPPRRRPSTSFALLGYPHSRRNGGHSRKVTPGGAPLSDMLRSLGYPRRRKNGGHSAFRD